MENNERNGKLKVIASKLAKKSTWVKGLAAALALTAAIGIGSIMHDGNNDVNNDIPSNDNEIVIDIDQTEEPDIDDENIDIDIDIEEDIPSQEDEDVLEPSLDDEDLNEDITDGFDYGSVVIYDYDGVSIVEALAQNGYDHSFEFRAGLAEYYGIENYTGTAEQNLELLNILIQKGLDNGGVDTPEVNPGVDEEDTTGDNEEDTEDKIEDKTEEDTEDKTEDKTEEDTEDKTEDKTEEDTEDKTEDDTEDKEEEKIEPHKHSWSLWEKFTSIFEKRDCECGEEQTRRHTFGSWFRVNSSLEQRDCKTCDYEQTREIEKDHGDSHTHSFSIWKMLNSLKEERKCSCGVTQTRNHTFGVWINNGNGTETRDCNTCDYEETRVIEHTHTFSKWIDFSSTQEMRECECNRKEYRAHTFCPWILNGNVETRECETCDRVETRNVAHTHVWSNWQAKDDELESRTCECNQEQTRSHSFGAEQVTINSNNDGTHRVVTQKSCSTCNHVVTSDKSVGCTYGDWTYNQETGKEERSCECGYIEEKEHTHSSQPTDLVFIVGDSHNNGTHEMKASYECSICHETINVTKDVDCTYGEWVKDGDYHKASCECGHSITQQHIPSGSVSYRNNDGTIVEVFKCESCGADIEQTHSHTYGNWQYKDENTEERNCICGYETSTQSHSYGEPQVSGGVTISICSSCGHEKKIEQEQECQHADLEAGDKNYVKTDDICYEYTITCKNPDCTYTEVISEGHGDVEYLIDGADIYYQCLVCNHEWSRPNPDYPIAPASLEPEEPITKEQYEEIVEEVIEEIIKEEHPEQQPELADEPEMGISEDLEEGKREGNNLEDSKSLTLIP